MTFTKIAVAGGVVLLGFLCFLAARGMAAVTEGLVTLFALAVLVAGGNLLSGRGAYGARGATSPSAPAGATAPEAPAPTGDPARVRTGPAAEQAGGAGLVADTGQVGDEGEAGGDVIEPPEPGET